MGKSRVHFVETTLHTKCNMCGKEFEIENDILKEDAFIVKKEWGYFSEKDCEIHSFSICEHCYDEMIASFKLPVDVSNKQEVLGT